MNREQGTGDRLQGIVCAWCKGVMQEGSEPVSHGMCEGCRGEFDMGAAPLVDASLFDQEVGLAYAED